MPDDFENPLNDDSEKDKPGQDKGSDQPQKPDIGKNKEGSQRDQAEEGLKGQKDKEKGEKPSIPGQKEKQDKKPEKEQAAGDKESQEKGSGEEKKAAEEDKQAAEKKEQQQEQSEKESKKEEGAQKEEEAKPESEATSEEESEKQESKSEEKQQDQEEEPSEEETEEEGEEEPAAEETQEEEPGEEEEQAETEEEEQDAARVEGEEEEPAEEEEEKSPVEEAKDVVNETWGAIKGTFQKIKEAAEEITEEAKSLWEENKGILEKIDSELVDKLEQAWQDTQNICEDAEAAGADVEESIGNAEEAFNGAMDAFEEARQALEAAQEAVQEATQATLQAAIEKAQEAVDLILGAKDKGQNAVELAQSAWEQLQQAIENCEKAAEEEESEEEEEEEETEEEEEEEEEQEEEEEDEEGEETEEDDETGDEEPEQETEFHIAPNLMNTIVIRDGQPGPEEEDEEEEENPEDEVRLIEIADVQFRTNSAVPSPLEEPAEVGGQIPALEAIKLAYNHQHENPDEQLLIAGHTDTTATARFNFELSSYRARVIRSLMKNDLDEWNECVTAKSRIEDKQAILKYFHGYDGMNCDPGPVDGVQGPRTNEAIRGFQRGYNRHVGADEIAVDGLWGRQTWGAVFNLYIELLYGNDGDRYNPSDLNWLSSREISACGESIPQDHPGADNYRSQENRRVEILFLNADEEIEFTCCTETGPFASEVCDRDSCPLYGLRDDGSPAHRFRNITGEVEEETTNVKVILQDIFGKPLANIEYTLKYLSGERSGTTDDQGILVEEDVPVGPLRIALEGGMYAKFGPEEEEEEVLAVVGETFGGEEEPSA